MRERHSSWWPQQRLIGASHFGTDDGGGSGGDHTNLCKKGASSSSANPVAHDDTNLPLPREPSYDDDGNEISAFAFSYEESSLNSLDEHSHSESNDIYHDSSKSDSSY